MSTEQKKGRQPEANTNSPELLGHTPAASSLFWKTKTTKKQKRRLGSITSSAVFWGKLEIIQTIQGWFSFLDEMLYLMAK